MSLSNFQKKHEEYVTYIKSTGIKNYMFYAPSDEKKYWNQKNRILIVNMEPYGYENCGFVNANEEVGYWLHDAGHTNTKTVKYSVLFSSILMRALTTGETADIAEIRKRYYDNKLLDDTLSKITVYNIKPTSNSVKAQDVHGIIGSSNGRESEFLKAEIEALDAKYIIVSGRAGLVAFKRVMGIREKIETNMPVIVNGMLILAVNHFSRPSYDVWIENIGKILTVCKT